MNKITAFYTCYAGKHIPTLIIKFKDIRASQGMPSVKSIIMSNYLHSRSSSDLKFFPAKNDPRPKKYPTHKLITKQYPYW